MQEAYDCQRLLHIFRACTLTRAPRLGFVDQLCHCLHVILPPQQAQLLEKKARRSGVLPSTATLQRQKFLLDMALICLRQQRENIARMRFLLIDSSPQLGRNWLWIDETSVSTDQIIPAAAAQTQLTLQLQLFLAKVPRLYQSTPSVRVAAEEILEVGDLCAHSALQASQTILQSATEHTYTPVCLGNWKSDAVGKASALCHALGLENPTCGKLTKALAEVRALCTDMGAELSFTELLVNLTPSWMETPVPRSMEIGSLEELDKDDPAVESGALDPASDGEVCDGDMIGSGNEAQLRQVFGHGFPMHSEC